MMVSIGRAREQGRSYKVHARSMRLDGCGRGRAWIQDQSLRAIGGRSFDKDIAPDVADSLARPKRWTIPGSAAEDHTQAALTNSRQFSDMRY